MVASYVGEPACNHRFQTLEEARRTTTAFIMRYNRGRLIERLNPRTLAQARAAGNWGIGPTHTKA